MSEPIFDITYWATRLNSAVAKGELHHAVFKCPLERWRNIERKHKEVLASLVFDSHSVLDAACGYGRLVDLMPKSWHGRYVGVDISPDFVHLAREKYTEHPCRPEFVVDDLRELKHVHGHFDWAVLVSVRPMVIRNVGHSAWDAIETKLKTVADRILFLEYDETAVGDVKDGCSKVLHGKRRGQDDGSGTTVVPS